MLDLKLRLYNPIAFSPEISAVHTLLNVSGRSSDLVDGTVRQVLITPTIELRISSCV